jgi:hypothetical protein
MKALYVAHKNFDDEAIIVGRFDENHISVRDIRTQLESKFGKVEMKQDKNKYVVLFDNVDTVAELRVIADYARILLH